MKYMVVGWWCGEQAWGEYDSHEEALQVLEDYEDGHILYGAVVTDRKDIAPREQDA